MYDSAHSVATTCGNVQTLFGTPAHRNPGAKEGGRRPLETRTLTRQKSTGACSEAPRLRQLD